MYTEALQGLGLNEREIAVYTVLVKEGTLSAAEIAKATKIHRTTVYLELENLQERGLVTYLIRNHRRLFTAIPPKRLLDIQDERREKVAEVVEELEAMEQSSKKATVQVFQGKEGGKYFFQDALREGKEIVVFGGTGRAFEIYRYYFPQLINQVLQQDMPISIIANEEAKVQFEPLGEYGIDVRYIPEKYRHEVTTIVYGGKVAIQKLIEDDIYIILIEDAMMAESYRATFSFLWDALAFSL